MADLINYKNFSSSSNSYNVRNTSGTFHSIEVGGTSGTSGSSGSKGADSDSNDGLTKLQKARYLTLKAELQKLFDDYESKSTQCATLSSQLDALLEQEKRVDKDDTGKRAELYKKRIQLNKQIQDLLDQLNTLSDDIEAKQTEIADFLADCAKENKGNK